MEKEEIVIETSDKHDAPLVILFGWAGCRDRYLSKYSDIYKENGFSVVRHTADVRRVTSYQSYQTFAYKLYDKALRNNNSSYILCHAFSMNGASLFSSLWKILNGVEDGDAIKKKIKGVIFDSAPAFTSPWQLAVAVSVALFPPTKLGMMVRGLYRICLASFLLLFNARIWLRSYWQANAWENNYGYYHLCSFSDLPKKQMFIYSKIDNICKPEDIESFIEKQEALGVKCRRVTFDDSQHVEHLRCHRDEYIKSCMEFLHSLN